MDKTHPFVDDAALEDAAEWLLRIEDAPDVLTSEAFERWLHADPVHVTAFNALANEWGAAETLGLDQLAAVSRQVKPASQGMFGALLDTFRKPWFAGGLGALAAVGLALVLFLDPLAPAGAGSTVYETAKGEVSTFDLADGSLLILDSASSAKVTLDKAQRLVELAGGRVFVDVEPDRDRPFMVTSEGASFTALGTAYAVERADDGWRLEVYEGTVRAITPSAVEEFTAGTGAFFSEAGLTRFDLGETLLGDQPDWTSERVVFEGTTLADALKAFERYSDSQVDIADEDLRSYKVSGVFRLTDMGSFLKSVEILSGAQLRTLSPGHVRLEPAQGEDEAGNAGRP